MPSNADAHVTAKILVVAFMGQSYANRAMRPSDIPRLLREEMVDLIELTAELRGHLDG
jgi:hypothetical protein